MSNPTQEQLKELLRRACDGSLDQDQRASLVRVLRQNNLSRRLADEMLQGRFPGVVRSEEMQVVAEIAETESEDRSKTSVSPELLGESKAPPNVQLDLPQDCVLKSTAIQARVLAKHFQGLDTSHVEAIAQQMVVSEGFEGLVVVPKFSAVMGNQQMRWPDFNRAVLALLGVLKKEFRRLLNNLGSEIGPDCLSLDSRTSIVLERMGEQTPGDCLVFPMQSVSGYPGVSPAAARESFGSGEFGMDPFAVGCMLLVHPRRLRLASYQQISCTGARYKMVGQRKAVSVPVWRHTQRGLRLGLLRAEESRDGFSIASGFWPLGGRDLKAAVVDPTPKSPSGGAQAGVGSGEKSLLEF